MKKVLLVVTTTLLLSISGNCQWYSRKYGVSDLNQLSQIQLNEALIRAKDGMSSGAVISIISGIGIVGGIIRATRDSPYPGDIWGNITGLLLLAGSIPFEITGLLVRGINRSRAKRIEEVLNKAEIKFGLLNCSIGLAGSSGFTVAGFSVTLRF